VPVDMKPDARAARKTGRRRRQWSQWVPIGMWDLSRPVEL